MPPRHAAAQRPLPSDVEPLQALVRSAVFDASGRYRYSLKRRWAPGGESVAFVLLNPSTADAERDDPTIRRCMGFARDWGYASLEVVNLFAWRATHPESLRLCPEPVGPQNDACLLAAARRAARTVLAWGVHGALYGRDHDVCALLAQEALRLDCLGTTRGGHPRHVLYLPRDARPAAFAPGDAP
jgi:hypothetical protein